LDKLPGAVGETWGIQIAASESWDAALGTEIADFGTVDVELALEHDLEMGL
jgi:hypothetical protein